MNCRRCLMDDSIEGITIRPSHPNFTSTNEGQCCMCDAHDKHEVAQKDLQGLWDQIAHDGRGRRFDCLIGVSGGLDSTFLTICAKNAGLRVLLCHFDNGYNDTIADDNINSIINRTGLPMVRFSPDLMNYRAICRALIESGLPDADIANDIGMAKFSLDVAKQYGIKWILNGHNYQYEGWNPIGWTYMDGRYLSDIAKKCGGVSVPDYMRLDLIEQFTSGVKHARPYYHFHGLHKADMEDTCRKAVGWKSYGSKHCENIYTEWVGSVYLPMMGIDKRRNYLSADIRCGRITKESAGKALAVKPQFDPQKATILAYSLGFDSVIEFMDAYNASARRNRSRSDFDSYRPALRRFWPLVWAASKVDMVPESFYRKYCR